MSDDEVLGKILSLKSEARRTNLPVFLLEKLLDCLAVQITQADLVGLGAHCWSEAILTVVFWR